MISKKSILFFLCTALLSACLITGCGASEESGLEDLSNMDAGKLPVSTMQASYICNLDDPREAAGAADYVFAGTVIRGDRTEYRHPVPMEDENGNTVELGAPYTHYTVQVMENIKGALQKDNPINVVKSGGIEQNKKSVSLYEDDFLPEAEKTYIFLAYVQEDGSLLVSGPNSNILIPAEASDQIAKSQEYKTYKEAVEHQIIPEALKANSGAAISIYDEQYKKSEHAE